MVSPYTGNLSPLHAKGTAKSLRNLNFARKKPIWEHFVIHTKCVLIPTIFSKMMIAKIILVLLEKVI